MNFLLQKSQMCRLTPVCSRAACVRNAADISVTEDFNSEQSDWLERAMADNWGDFYTPECSLNNSEVFTTSPIKRFRKVTFQPIIHSTPGCSKTGGTCWWRRRRKRSFWIQRIG